MQCKFYLWWIYPLILDHLKLVPGTMSYRHVQRRLSRSPRLSFSLKLIILFYQRGRFLRHAPPRNRPIAALPSPYILYHKHKWCVKQEIQTAIRRGVVELASPLSSLRIISTDPSYWTAEMFDIHLKFITNSNTIYTSSLLSCSLIRLDFGQSWFWLLHCVLASVTALYQGSRVRLPIGTPIFQTTFPVVKRL